ncbi:hypothetical protein REJC140_03045 [Pseudorhizobium endolithicum]|uniref:Uncharacterized protein n=1 Tax=Pseudorhizobium endolithicum TaxID=1191678 RepID=A0ABN7JK23_9HYPH|nr:hypothetical protein [Pseudorhizobium endolithicum]CAD7032373.1 hypothetical protein REJC140_03045 [Pseudorhizobium endolithicum]
MTSINGMNSVRTRINESGTYITGGVTSCAETGFTEHLQYDPESGF